MADLTEADIAKLVKAEVGKALAAATAKPEPRRFLEATSSGPARQREQAAAALKDAGYKGDGHDPIHADDTDGWLTVEVEWTRDGNVDGDFQAHHLAAMQRALQPYSYELRTYGVAAGVVTRH